MTPSADSWPGHTAAVPTPRVTGQTGSDAGLGGLAGKTALITGGIRGIGRAIAQRLAVEGAKVCVTTRSAASEPAATREGITVLRADPATAEDMARAVAAAGGRDGLDICVANAGAACVEDFLNAERATWERVLRANLLSVLVTLQAAARGMRAHGRGGRLVVIASAAGVRPEAQAAVYGATKAAAVALVQALGAELAPYRITVNAIAPGTIDTEMLRRASREFEVMQGRPEGSGEQEIGRRIPLGRLGRPDEVAAVAGFLAREEASYMTGSTVLIDGGITLAMCLGQPDVGRVSDRSNPPSGHRLR